MDLASCPFCQIVAEKAPAKVVYRSDRVTAFHDRNPVTPVHILVVPNRHIESVSEVGPEDRELIGECILVAGQIARDQNLVESGYRLVFNHGHDAGQTVSHVHLHLLGGRRMPFRFYGQE